MSFIKLSNVGKSYLSNRVLNDINLDFSNNEFVCILGPSGSGKTTLLNVIGMIENQDEGKYYVDEKLLKDKQKQLYRYNFFSYVYQNYELIDYYNIKENITINTSDYNEDYLNELCEKFNCLDMLEKYPNELSGGEKQKISLIRALIKKPRIIICDEPTGSLDNKNSEIVMQHLKDMSENRLIIMATHNVELAKKYATRIIILNSGKVVSDSSAIHDDITIPSEIVPYRKLSKNLFMKNIKFFCRAKHKLFIMISLFALCLTILSCSLGFISGSKQYINMVQNERLDSKYFELSYYKNDIETSNHDSIIKLLNGAGIQYVELNNYTFLFNNFIYRSIKQQNEIDFDFDIAVIDLGENENSVLCNSLFSDLYNKEDLLLTDTIQILDYLIDMDEMFTIRGTIEESKIYNTPKLYISYKYAETLFPVEFKEYIFLQDEIVVPNYFLFSTPIDDVYKIFSENEYFTSYIEAATTNVYKFVIYKSSSVIMQESFKDLTNSIIYCLILISIILLVLVFSIFNLFSKNLFHKRKRELGIMYSYGTSKQDISKLIFLQNFYIIGFSYIISLILYYIIHIFVLNKSLEMIGKTFNIIEFEVVGIVTGLYVVILLCILSSVNAINKSNLKLIVEELHNE